MSSTVVRATRGALLVIALSACGGSRAPGRVVLDLASTAAVADLQSSWDVVRLGTPSAQPFLEKGFSEERPATRFADPYAPTKVGPQIRVRWDPAPRLAVIDLAAYTGLTGQTADVFLNNRAIGRLDVSERQRHGVPIPPEVQRRGINRLRFAFSKATARDTPEAPPFTARLYSVVIGPASDASLRGLLATGAPPVLAVNEDNRIPSLVQAGPSALRYAIRLPKSAELRFTPSPAGLALDGPGGTSPRPRTRAASLRVTLEEEWGAERTVWTHVTVAGRGSAEARVPLTGRPGTLVRLGLHVDAAPGEPSPWGMWTAPRVVGDGAVDLLPELYEPQKDDRPAEKLRQGLAGSNVLLILLDAAGARHFGCYGYPRATTPEIDRIAAEGVVFERAYTPVVFTSSAVSSLFTSQYPDEHHNGIPPNAPLPSDRLTLAEVLSRHGIHTAAFTANSNSGPANAVDRGFVEFDETYRRNVGAFDPLKASTMREAVAPWLRSRRDGKPFFAYVHFREPHFPYDPPAPFNTLFGPDAPLGPIPRKHLGWINAVNSGGKHATQEEIEHLVRLYDGNLAYGDHEVGMLRKALEDAGLWDRTVVTVIADHGEALSEHGFIGHNDQVYEESVRVPIIMRFPKGKGPTGVRVKGLADLLDLAPTVTDIFGLRGAGGSDREFHGRSLLPAILGGPGKPAVISRTAWRKLRYALGDGRFKLIYDVKSAEAELYDIESDPEERSDLAESQPVRAAYYRQALHRWLLDLGFQRRGKVRETTLTPEQLENLKALGYVQ